MSSGRTGQTGGSWLLAAVGGTAAVALLAAAAGFIWFPSSEKAQGIWQAICTAAGITRAGSAAEPLPAGKANSTVILAAGMLENPSAVSIGRGATLGHECAICHGAHTANQVDTPELAGQFAPAIYKELQDFKSGARVSAVMTPLVANLTDRDMRDLAAYFAYLPRAFENSAGAAPPIVATGVPMRNIPPCGACHGDPETKPGAPRLEGESATYIRNQLIAFADGARRNDISQQMRNIARQMTGVEIEAAAQYYASAPTQ